MKKIKTKIVILILLWILSFSSVNAYNFWTNLESIYPKVIWENIYWKKYTPVRVLLSTPKEFNYFYIQSKDELWVRVNEDQFINIKTKSIVWVYFKKKLYLAYKRINKLNFEIYSNQLSSIQILSTKKDQILEVKWWDRIPSWSKSWRVNDNLFLWWFDIRYRDWFLNLVNEVDIKDYMKWIAEVPEKDEKAKRKALQVISRSYIKYYLSKWKYKFPWKQYNASDDPKVFQKYKWYWFTKRSPKWQESLTETEGQILVYKDQVVKTAYFSCTWPSGYTKTPNQAWWKDPYFTEVKDVYISIKDIVWVDLERSKKWYCGHWVWLSGKGATELAKRWMTYIEILTHYYQNISIKVNW